MDDDPSTRFSPRDPQTKNFLIFFLLIIFITGTAQALSLPGTIEPMVVDAANAGIAKEIYLAANTRGREGTGAADDPLDLSTAAKFDAFWSDQENRAIPTIYHFAAGNYYTHYGITPRPNQHFIGAGEDITKIFLQSNSFAFTNGWNGICNIACQLNGRVVRTDNVSIENMTLDGGANFSAVPLTASFTTPPVTPGSNTVNVSVGSTSGLTIGYCYYVQDRADANGTKLYFGTYLLSAINSPTSITLQNLGTIPYSGAIPGGRIAPATALLLPYSNSATKTGLALFRRPGIMLLGSGMLVRNVTVQNVACPAYEGPAGIGIGGQGSERNNKVEHCTVRDVYGTAGSYLWIVDNAISAVAFSQCDLIENTVLGNGYYQGISGWQFGNSHFLNNTIKNVQIGYFCDSGSGEYNTIEGNTFILSGVRGGQAGIYMQGNGAIPNVHDCLFAHNTIILPLGSGKPGIWVADPSSNNSYIENRIIGYGRMAILVTSKGAGNVFSGNVIDNTFARFGVIGPHAVGTENGNVDQNHNPISIGFSKIAAPDVP